VQRAGIGREPHLQPALDEFNAKCLGGKQMAAGTTRGQQNERLVLVHALK